MAISFGSDNHSGIHPKVLQSLIEANVYHAPAYGTDDLTLELNKKVQALFGVPCDTQLVFNGTGANVLALNSLTQKHGSTLVTECSHFWNDECGAVEAITGTKLVPCPHIDGKFDFEKLKTVLFRGGDQHFSQIQVISLTQPSELGTCYTLDEIAQISHWAHSKNLKVHIDGARFANSLSFLGCSPQEFLQRTRIDSLSWGGTKNGLMGAELVVTFQAENSRQIKFLRKQMCQLPSKTRFLSSQFLAYLDDDLYLKIAQSSHSAAQYLSKGLKDHGITSNYPVESNAVFVNLKKEWIKPLREKFFFYVWNESSFECRLMTSWDTSETMIDQFLKEVSRLR